MGRLLVLDFAVDEIEDVGEFCLMSSSVLAVFLFDLLYC